MVEKLRMDIKEFKSKNKVDKVIILWTANTERYADVVEGVNDTAGKLDDIFYRFIKKTLWLLLNEESTKFHQALYMLLLLSWKDALTSTVRILHRYNKLTGSPQNTFVPGLIDLAVQKGVHIGGDDFKSGQTKMKSVLTDFLISAGLKVNWLCQFSSFK